MKRQIALPTAVLILLALLLTACGAAADAPPLDGPALAFFYTDN